MSEDKAVIEIQKDGTGIDLTAALSMACTTGFNAAEALAAVSHTCELCEAPCVGVSCVILMCVAAVGAEVVASPVLQQQLQGQP